MPFRRCSFLAILFPVLLFGTPALAQKPEEKYLADRDAAIARFTPDRVPNIGQAQMDEEAAARAALDRQLVAIVGAKSPKGFGPAQSNISSLFTGDIDFGKLDGVVFESKDGQSKMVITTMPLLVRWLNATTGLPKDAEQAIADPSFFMQALPTDAAILHYADVPIGAPRTKAMLGARTQDRAPDAADEVFVVSIRGDRVYVANSRLKRPITAPACRKLRDSAERRIEAAEKKGLNAGQDNSAWVDATSKMREEADASFQKCFAGVAVKDARFAAAVTRANELFGRMSAQ